MIITCNYCGWPCNGRVAYLEHKLAEHPAYRQALAKTAEEMIVAELWPGMRKRIRVVIDAKEKRRNDV